MGKPAAPQKGGEQWFVGDIFSAHGPNDVIGSTHGLPRLGKFLEAMEAYKALFEREEKYIKLSYLPLQPYFCSLQSLSPPFSKHFSSVQNQSKLKGAYTLK